MTPGLMFFEDDARLTEKGVPPYLHLFFFIQFS